MGRLLSHLSNKNPCQLWREDWFMALIWGFSTSNGICCFRSLRDIMKKHIETWKLSTAETINNV